MGGDINERRRKAALDAIERECARDLPPAELLVRVNERLMTAVGYQRYGWVLLDPMTITSVGSMMTQCGLALYSQTSAYEFSQDDAFCFRALARAPSPVTTLWQVTDGDPWHQPRYRNLIGPFGGGDELRAVFRAGGLSWAAVHLGRDMGSEPFSADSAAMIADVGRIVGNALRRAMAPAVPGSTAFPAAFTWNAPPGVVVLNGDNEIESLSPQAARICRQAGEADDTGLPLPVAVYAVAIQARAIAAGQRDGTPASARMRLASGDWLALDAEPLDNSAGAPGSIAVVVQPARPAHLVPLVLAAAKLTPRERQIAQILLRGDGTEQIAQQLIISRYTLRDHVKAIYAKFGVTSRSEFAALMLDQVPTEEAGDTPIREAQDV